MDMGSGLCTRVRMTALMDPLVAHLGPISDPHGQTHCTELMDKLLWAPGLRISITCAAHMDMPAILFK